LLDQGYQPASIAKQLATVIRTQLTGGDSASSEMLNLLTNLLEVPLSHDPEAQLEVALMRPGAVASPQVQVAPTVVVETAPARKPATEPVERPQSHPEPKVKEVAPKEKTVEKVAEEVPITTEKPTPKATGNGILTPESWQEVLNLLKKQHNTLYGIVRMAQPDFSQTGALQLAFGFAFHQKRANEAKNRKIIGDAIATVVGSDIELTCVFDSEAKVAQPVLATSAPTANADNSLSTISNIFGGVEMVE
jgi:outer membrane biosynthesis protein TonB